MKALRPFEVVLLGFFGVMAIGGLLFFVLYDRIFEPEIGYYGNSVIIWGTFDDFEVNEVLFKIMEDDRDFQVVSYKQMDPRTFDSELVNAIAEGRSPDLVLLPSDLLVKHRAKILSLTYEQKPERDFKDSYVDGAEIFLLNDGFYGWPIMVDPLMMYWNRTMFANAGLAVPPTTWETVLSSTLPSINRITTDLDVLQSAVAFGEYDNITNAKEILTMLLFQAGTNIVTEQSGDYLIDLYSISGGGGGLPPGDAALSFYTQFANPVAGSYSWNRSLQRDDLQFLGERLALYFGMGSEYASLAERNPNLNFDVTDVPQGATSNVKRTYGKFYALSILKVSENPQGAFRVAEKLGSAEFSQMFAENLELAPVHRSILSQLATDSVRASLYRASLIAQDWLDPDVEVTENLMRTMITDVTSGRRRVNDAVSDYIDRLGLLFK